MNFLDASSLALAITICVIALASFCGFSAASFRLRQARLPDATAYEDIRERRISEEKRIEDLRSEARTIEQQIKDRDRVSAEVAALQERRDAITFELATLDSARAQIEETKQDAANVAGDLAAALQDLKRAKERLAEITSDIEKQEKQLEEMPERIAWLEETLRSLKEEKQALDSILPELRTERDQALQRIEEARVIQARMAALNVQLEKVEDEIDALTKERDGLREESAKLQLARDEYARLQEDLSRLEARRSSLEVEIEKAKNRLPNGANGVSGNPKDAALLLEDITQFPACLSTPATINRAQKTESETLGTMAKYIKDCGLEYDYRTLRAFHTCLKINDHAQITVLAGVSGTGKSILPRRYAEAMGIHFHQIAVEPRWDSPQDLLGFYNYIEQKYRATDLARLLVHMDPYRSVPIEVPSEDRRDHMALVLLDEMNLARVEYYFSEFLSRLEVRPRLADVGDEIRRKNAMIPIDIRGYDKSLALFPSHNVLFAGTMNDDESTQALSDKVLDRGNVIQFAAPKSFNLPDSRNPSIPTEALSFGTWRRWIQNVADLGADRDTAEDIVVKLASIMDDCGRPFGHRLRDAILGYAANYPKGVNGRRDIRDPLADQIELRILPKLRGLEIEGHESSLTDLATLVRIDLGDIALADRLEGAIERQRVGNGLFVWRGLTRQS